MMVELIADFFAEYPATAGSDKVDTHEADEVIDAIAKVFCLNMSDAKITATANQALIGTDVRTLKFMDDPFGQRIYDATKGTPEESVATVDYNCPKPGTTEHVPKQSFVTCVGEQGCGVGYYK
jgi:hypothetical protein